MSVSLDHLERKVDQILAVCASLRDENQTLRVHVAGLEAEKAALARKIDITRERLEALMTRLPNSKPDGLGPVDLHEVNVDSCFEGRFDRTSAIRQIDHVDVGVFKDDVWITHINRRDPARHPGTVEFAPRRLVQLRTSARGSHANLVFDRSTPSGR